MFMLNLEESIKSGIYYKKQKKIFEKILFLVFPTFKISEIFRARVAEVDILQLVPGVYFFFLFFFLFFLFCFSSFSFSCILFLDNIKTNGIKTLSRYSLFSKSKVSFLFFSFLTLFAINTFIPLTLDSLISSGEKSLENYWSLIEILILEIFLVLSLNLFSQLPIFLIAFISLERKIQTLSNFWKIFSFFSILIAGIITPTLDAFIQAFLALVTILFYFGILIFLQKRLNIKFSGFSNFS